jgi:hypothetical protein
MSIFVLLIAIYLEEMIIFVILKLLQIMPLTVMVQKMLLLEKRARLPTMVV